LIVRPRDRHVLLLVKRDLEATSPAPDSPQPFGAVVAWDTHGAALANDQVTRATSAERMRGAETKKLWIGLGLLIVVATVTWVLLARHHGQESTYRLVPIKRGSLESVVSATGNLEATKTVSVGTQVSGQISAIYVDFNDHVKKGQLIARIDPTLLQQQVLASEANREKSQADLDDAKSEAERQQTLFTQGLAAGVTLKTAQYKYSVTEASFKLSQVNLDSARRNLTYSAITAPIDGVVIARNVDVGQTVAASLSAPTLFVIAQDLTKMQILASVDESDIGRVHENQKVRFTVQSFPNASFVGNVSQVRLQSTISENVVSYTAVVAVDNTDGRLLPGMTATVQFVVDSAEGVLMVSNSALRFTPSGATSAETTTAATNQNGAQAQRTSGSGARIAGQARGNAATSGRGLLWYLDVHGKLASTTVSKGISNGQFTQIAGTGVKEGMQVIAAVAGTTTTAGTNPFQTQQGARPSGPGPGM
jgi:HlyD family secretion protein